MLTRGNLARAHEYAISAHSSRPTARNIYYVHYSIPILRINLEISNDAMPQRCVRRCTRCSHPTPPRARLIAQVLSRSKSVCRAGEPSPTIVLRETGLRVQDKAAFLRVLHPRRISPEISHVRIDARVYARAHVSSVFLPKNVNTCGFHGRETPGSNWRSALGIRHMVHALLEGREKKKGKEKAPRFLFFLSFRNGSNDAVY